MRNIIYLAGLAVIVLAILRFVLKQSDASDFSDVVVIRLRQLACEEPLKRIQIDRLELPEPLHPDGGTAHRVGFQLAPLHAPSLFL